LKGLSQKWLNQRVAEVFATTRDDEEWAHTTDDYTTQNERRHKKDRAASSSVWSNKSYFSRTLSLAETNRVIDSEAHVKKTSEMSNGKFSSEKLSEGDISELKNMLANVLPNKNNSNKELQDKMDKM
jgi:hypothetical protein